MNEDRARRVREGSGTARQRPIRSGNVDSDTWGRPTVCRPPLSPRPDAGEQARPESELVQFRPAAYSPQPTADRGTGAARRCENRPVRHDLDVRTAAGTTDEGAARDDARA